MWFNWYVNWLTLKSGDMEVGDPIYSPPPPDLDFMVVSQFASSSYTWQLDKVKFNMDKKVKWPQSIIQGIMTT